MLLVEGGPMPADLEAFLERAFNTGHSHLPLSL